MIPYSKSFIGIQLLCQINGSSLYRAALIQGLISLAFFLLLRILSSTLDDHHWILDPLIVEVLIASVTLLIVFRVNHSYERYWSACGHVHHMMSLWMDAATQASVYYMQQKYYDGFKPPSYFHHFDLNRYGLSRDRQRQLGSSSSSSFMFPIAILPPVGHTAAAVDTTAVDSTAGLVKMPSILHTEGDDDESLRLLRHYSECQSSKGHVGYLFQRGARLDNDGGGGWGRFALDDENENNNNSDNNIENDSSTGQTTKKTAVVGARGFASDQGGRTPSLYLQELVHLASLCNAVAFATLRRTNPADGGADVDTDGGADVECFSYYHPGAPWPDLDSSFIRTSPTSNKTQKCGKVMLLLDRIKIMLESIILEECSTRPGIRKQQHASHPIPVLGGVSVNEYEFLQRARGSSAKVQLACSWFCEFMTREDLAGSFGGIGAPIISNIHASLSEGMAHYNHCRKIAFMPLPFPHAQIAAAYILSIMVMIPILLQEYIHNTVLGGLITILSVTCLAGLHEVARELENPFDNVPNEIPLTVLQAMFNDSLMTLFAGFHPDHYWNAQDFHRVYSRPS